MTGIENEIAEPKPDDIKNVNRARQRPQLKQNLLSRFSPTFLQ